MDKQTLLNQMIAQKPINYPQNPYWKVNNGQIYTKRDGHFSISWQGVQTLIQQALKYFQEVYHENETEAQVLVLTESDYHKLKIPVLALPSQTNLDELGFKHNFNTFAFNSSLRVVILPQVNTLTNTIISEDLWNKEIVNQHIWPIMRIHSHHHFNAYQSLTDWSSLNSGTLEMVLGKIDDEQIEVAYWLDTYGQNTKDTVYKTIDNGETVKTIGNGHDRGPTKFKTPYSNEA